MFSVSDLRKYLAYAKEQASLAYEFNKKEYWKKAIAKTEGDIKSALARDVEANKWRDNRLEKAQ